MGEIASNAKRFKDIIQSSSGYRCAMSMCCVHRFTKMQFCDDFAHLAKRKDYNEFLRQIALAATAPCSCKLWSIWSVWTTRKKPWNYYYRLFVFCDCCKQNDFKQQHGWHIICSTRRQKPIKLDIALGVLGKDAFRVFINQLRMFFVIKSTFLLMKLNGNENSLAKFRFRVRRELVFARQNEKNKSFLIIYV